MRSFNFFGLTISDDLKWHTNIRYVSRKISRSIGVINLQKKSIRDTTCSHYKAHTDPWFKSLKICML